MPCQLGFSQSRASLWRKKLLPPLHCHHNCLWCSGIVLCGFAPLPLHLGQLKYSSCEIRTSLIIMPFFQTPSPNFSYMLVTHGYLGAFCFCIYCESSDSKHMGMSAPGACIRAPLDVHELSRSSSWMENQKEYFTLRPHKTHISPYIKIRLHVGENNTWRPIARKAVVVGPLSWFEKHLDLCFSSVAIIFH